MRSITMMNEQEIVLGFPEMRKDNIFGTFDKP